MNVKLNSKNGIYKPFVTKKNKYYLTTQNRYGFV